jgi:hypothetical protein
MMGNGIPNNGLYVPTSGGTSIASIIQNKKQNGSSISTNNGGGYPQNYSNGSKNMIGSANGNAYLDQMARANANAYANANAFGFNVDQNGYPVPVERRFEAPIPPQRDARMMDTRSIDSIRGSRSDPQSDLESEYGKIMELANDVNNSLEVLGENEKRKKRKRRDTESDIESFDSRKSSHSRDSKSRKDSESDIDDNIENDENDEEGTDVVANVMNDGYGMIIIEPLLLLTIYVIMSQPFAINLASYYIDQLNPNEDNCTPLSGIIIYGVIMVILFMVLRRVVEYKINR